MTRAYVCVYRHFFPPPRAIADTRLAAARDPALLSFVDQYVAGTSYFDWGDDPSFFSAQQIQGSFAYAGWGVCRPNVRAALAPGDLVVFFCAKRQAPRTTETDYYFIGVGTVGEVIQDRRLIWTRAKYKAYRRHYNVLAKYKSVGGPAQLETFHPYHEDWEKRLKRPYVLFDADASRFNLGSPLHVGTSVNGGREVWRTGRRVARLEKLLFEDFGIKRRLRTSPTGTAHVHLNLTRRLVAASRTVEELRASLMPLV